MFGDLTIFARPVVSASPDDDSPAFPLFLLPTFQLPFRRRRSQSQNVAAAAEAATPDESSVPSLSSSPGSPPTTHDSSPSGSRNIRSYFSELPSFGDFRGKLDLAKDQKAPLPPAAGPRLARTQPDILRCKTCSADLGFVSQIVSKGFTGRFGRAFLVSPPSAQATPSCPSSPVNDNMSRINTEADLINIQVGRPENRQLVTGQHVVADIWCLMCDSKLGWKYVDAREAAQKYKVGKFILETQRVVAHHSWEDVDPLGRHGVAEDTKGPNSGTRASPQTARASTDTNSNSSTPRLSEESDLQDDDDGVIVFDSEDEDECEDIFAGVWDPDVVAKRRQSKVHKMKRGSAK